MFRITLPFIANNKTIGTLFLLVIAYCFVQIPKWNKSEKNITGTKAGDSIPFVITLCLGEGQVHPNINFITLSLPTCLRICIYIHLTDIAIQLHAITQRV